MSDTITLDALATEIRQRMDAIQGAIPDDAALQEKIRTTLAGLLDEPDSDLVRKIRFGRAPEHELVGTKYARAGLTVADVEFLHDMLRSAKAIGQSSGPSEELTNTVKAISEGRYLDVAVIRSQGEAQLADLFSRAPASWFGGDDRELVARGGWQETESFRRALRAMDTAESGFGSQLVGAQYVGELWRSARAQSRVFALIDTFPMTAASAFVPVEAGLPEMLFVPESTANNTSNFDTSKTGSQRVQVDAKKFVIHQMWSGEMEEDSIIPFVPFLREQAARSVAHYSDSLVINGDTTNAATGNINLDDANPADTKHYLAFDGVRHVGLVDNTGNSKDVAGAITFAELQKQKGRMLATTYQQDWGHPAMADRLVRIADPETADAVGLLEEVLTVDKYGQRATVLTGEVGSIGGHALIASQALSKTEADGKVSTTGSNNVKGQVVALNRDGFKAGWRRQVKTEVERIPGTDQTRVVYSMRLGFGRYSPTGAASGIECADVLYDISL